MINPASKPEIQEKFIYSHGMQHLAFVVEDIESSVAMVKQKGWDVFVDTYNYQDAYKLCYFCGPEGIIIELAEEL